MPNCSLARGVPTPPHKAAPHLEEDEELEDAAKGGWEEASIGHCHLEEERVEETIAHVDQGVLVEVGIADAPVVAAGGPAAPVVVGRVVVVGVRLVLGHPDAAARSRRALAVLTWAGGAVPSPLSGLGAGRPLQRGARVKRCLRGPGEKPRVGSCSLWVTGQALPRCGSPQGWPPRTRPGLRAEASRAEGGVRPGGARARLRGSAGRCLDGARERRGPSRPSGDTTPGPAPRPWGGRGKEVSVTGAARPGSERSGRLGSPGAVRSGAERPGPVPSAPRRHLPPPAPTAAATRLRQRRGELWDGGGQPPAPPRPGMQSRVPPAMHRAKPAAPHGGLAAKTPKFLIKRKV